MPSFPCLMLKFPLSQNLMSREVREQKLSEAQEIGALVLLAEAKCGELFNALPKAKENVKISKTCRQSCAGSRNYIKKRKKFELSTDTEKIFQNLRVGKTAVRLNCEQIIHLNPIDVK